MNPRSPVFYARDAIRSQKYNRTKIEFNYSLSGILTYEQDTIVGIGGYMWVRLFRYAATIKRCLVSVDK